MTTESLNGYSAFADQTCVVTVTYGDRSNLLAQAVEALRSVGVGKLIVVNNGSHPISRKKIEALAKDNNWIEVVSADENRGSAGGFRLGIERANSYSSFNFIWLLDDDNLPLAGSLRKLYAAHILTGENATDAFLSLREDRQEYVRAATKGTTVAVRHNSFMDFHINSALLKAYQYLTKRKKIDARLSRVFPLVPIHYAPYGGFLFHRAMLSKVGLPNEDYYLYGDDHEYSHRWIEGGGRIFLCAMSEIIDLEKSWNRKEGCHRFLDVESDEKKIYFSVRNRAAWEINNWITNRSIYAVNKTAYLIILFCLGLICRLRLNHLVSRYQLIRKALRDAKPLAQKKSVEGATEDLNRFG